MNGRMILMVTDAHSKWIDAYVTYSTSSATTTEKLRQCSATHGLPRMIVSDNGTSFTSAEFAEFTRRNGIEHKFVSPDHQASNGLAERSVGVYKSSLCRFKGGSLETNLSRLLFNYRITPHRTTVVAPCDLLMKRRLRSSLDKFRPSVLSRVDQNQQQQKASHDRTAGDRCISVGDPVFPRNCGPGATWHPGVVVDEQGPLSYTVRLQDSRVIRRHQDHVFYRHCLSDEPSPVIALSTGSLIPAVGPATPLSTSNVDSDTPTTAQDCPCSDSGSSETVPQSLSSDTANPSLHRSARPSNKPDQSSLTNATLMRDADQNIVVCRHSREFLHCTDFFSLV